MAPIAAARVSSIAAIARASAGRTRCLPVMNAMPTPASTAKAAAARPPNTAKVHVGLPCASDSLSECTAIIPSRATPRVASTPPSRGCGRSGRVRVSVPQRARSRESWPRPSRPGGLRRAQDRVDQVPAQVAGVVNGSPASVNQSSVASGCGPTTPTRPRPNGATAAATVPLGYRARTVVAARRRRGRTAGRPGRTRHGVARPTAPRRPCSGRGRPSRRPSRCSGRCPRAAGRSPVWPRRGSRPGRSPDSSRPTRRRRGSPRGRRAGGGRPAQRVASGLGVQDRRSQNLGAELQIPAGPT